LVSCGRQARKKQRTSKNTNVNKKGGKQPFFIY